MHNTIRGSFVNPPPNHPTGAAVGIDIGALVGYLWEKKWIFIIAGIVSVILGLVLAFATLPKCIQQRQR